jgi:hypothetical protein
MSLTHLIDGTANPVTVTTTGSEGQRIGVTTWPDLSSALAYAERISALCGGNILGDAA